MVCKLCAVSRYRSCASFTTINITKYNVAVDDVAWRGDVDWTRVEESLVSFSLQQVSLRTDFFLPCAGQVRTFICEGGVDHIVCLLFRHELRWILILQTTSYNCSSFASRFLVFCANQHLLTEDAAARLVKRSAPLRFHPPSSGAFGKRCIIASTISFVCPTLLVLRSVPKFSPVFAFSFVVGWGGCESVPPSHCYWGCTQQRRYLIPFCYVYRTKINTHARVKCTWCVSCHPFMGDAFFLKNSQIMEIAFRGLESGGP